jgi:hypothetical protein
VGIDWGGDAGAVPPPLRQAPGRAAAFKAQQAAALPHEALPFSRVPVEIPFPGLRALLRPAIAPLLWTLPAVVAARRRRMGHGARTRPWVALTLAARG